MAIGAAAAVAAVLAATGPAAAQQVIGRSRALVGRETPHPYAPAPAAGGIVWSDTVRHPGASFLKIRFTGFALAEGDFVVVRDPTSREVHRYDWTTPRPDFWSASVLADTVIVELHSVGGAAGAAGPGGAVGHGFALGGYAEGSFPAGPGGVVCPYFALCGANEECSPDTQVPPGLPCHPALRPEVCGYPGPDDAAYANRRPVCALIYVDCPDQDPDTPEFVFFCSGYQIDADGCLVLTSKHCQPASFCGGWGGGAAECWFNAEATSCYLLPSMKPIDRYVVTGELCCSTCKDDSPLCLSCSRPPGAPPDPFLDYALLQIAPIGDAPECSFYGELSLRETPPGIGEAVYRHHHSWGCQKQYSEGVVTAEDDQWPDYVIYDAIGAGGSSGSPVLSAVDHTVIAHNGYAGGNNDVIGCGHGKGSTMSAIVSDLRAQGCLAPPCPWDCGDGDGVVGIADFLAVLAQWGTAGPCDFDGDGDVGIDDFLALLANWGSCP